jgi:choline dehydrogenase-like flavoprotein
MANSVESADVVVVGGGSAGAVLAARLTQLGVISNLEAALRH